MDFRRLRYSSKWLAIPEQIASELVGSNDIRALLQVIIIILAKYFLVYAREYAILRVFDACNVLTDNNPLYSR